MSLEQCNFEADLDYFIENYATGLDVPEPLQYVPFQNLECKVQSMSISDNASEVSRGGSIIQQTSSAEPKRSVTGIGHLFNFQKPTSTAQKSVNPPLVMERSFMNDPNESSVMDSTFLYDPFEVADKTTILFTGSFQH